MNFKKSFSELKRPIVWVHYLIGTLLIYGFFKYILIAPFINQINIIGIILFYFSYVVLDRISHGILELF